MEVTNLASYPGSRSIFKKLDSVHETGGIAPATRTPGTRIEPGAPGICRKPFPIHIPKIRERRIKARYAREPKLA